MYIYVEISELLHETWKKRKKEKKGEGVTLAELLAFWKVSFQA